jgi:Ni/Co efflux regulator RcnB
MSSTTLRRLTHLALAAALAATTGFAVAQQGPGRGEEPVRQEQHTDFKFQNEHRTSFQQHYQGDAAKWRNNSNRAHFQAGQAIPRNYAIQSVPSSYYRGAPPPPAGYRYGYYQGYVVAYNPTTRIVADVLDLVTGN